MRRWHEFCKILERIVRTATREEREGRICREAEDKVCLIMGSGKGIGAATARAFANEGAVVEIWATSHRIGGSGRGGDRSAGGRAYAMHLDVTDGASAEAWKDAVLSWHGWIDVLFKNAGISAVGQARSREGRVGSSSAANVMAST